MLLNIIVIIFLNNFSAIYLSAGYVFILAALVLTGIMLYMYLRLLQQDPG